jgi:hypothetical protein
VADTVTGPLPPIGPGGPDGSGGSAVSGDVRPTAAPPRAVWTVAAGVGTAGVALCVTLVTRSIWLLMGLPSSGAFEPPDAAIGAVPASILASVVFIALQRAAATRARGFDILGATWIALFGALGAVFVMRRNALPPQASWVFWLVGATFLVMSLGALVIQTAAYVFDRPDPRFQRQLGRKPSGGPFYVAATLAGAGLGVAAALAAAAALGF